MKDIILKNFKEQAELLQRLSQTKYVDDILHVTDVIVKAIKGGKKILIAGNGGSAADAQHFAAELVGRFEMEREGLPAIALTTDTSVITSLANDYEYSSIFARQIKAIGNSQDVFIGISTSGNSDNIVKAVEEAKRKKIIAVGMIGASGILAEQCDAILSVDYTRTCRIQEVHEITIHTICQLVEQQMSYRDK